MFVVPKSAGGRPWFLGSLAAVALASAGAGAWIVHAIAPETQAATASKAKLPERVVYVLGAEGEGMSPELASACDLKLSIPGSGAVESLNVASATAVLLASWRRAV